MYSLEVLERELRIAIRWNLKGRYWVLGTNWIVPRMTKGKDENILEKANEVYLEQVGK